ncbi:MAG: Fic family protein [Actinobacteria bacterium]|nr:Fic family protein [Actinomycetota bacterium]
MATVIKSRWVSDLTVGLPRRDRRGCEYEAYLPDLLEGRSFLLDGAVAADVADAERAVQRLDSAAKTLISPEALARLLLRAESVASSHIEGLEVGGRRLLRAEAARALGVPAEDVTAEEVLRNIDAMTWAVTTLANAEAVTVDGLLEVHRRLLVGTRLEGQAGQVRETQNWIGGSSYNPCSAAFVPPPWEEVRPLLEDLCLFCNDDELPAVAQAAIAHAQFETIHPFADGNGRTGRALIHVILRRRGLAPRVLPPVSLVLATWAGDYVSGLMATRYLGSPDSEAAISGLNRWIGLFAAACGRAVDDALRFELRVQEIQAGWRAALGRVRRNSAVDLLIAALPGAPIVTVNSASQLIGRSFERTNEAVAKLEAAGVIRRVTVGRRNRAFEARAVIDAFADLERQLASPAGDTRSSPPERPAPRRREE